MVQSAQDFIRALKAPSDPPQANGPTKIAIARATWDDSTFYVPNKEEVVADWVLTRLLKDKGKEPSSNPLLDARYWELLRDVFTASTGAAKSAAATRPTKTWLVPLLNRTPIAPITVALFAFIAADPSAIDSALVNSASQCLCLLWPLAVPKFTADALLECFGAVIGVFSAIASASPVPHIASMIVASYTAAASNTGNRKKFYAGFTEHHLRPWLDLLTTTFASTSTSNTSVRQLSEDIYAAGIETLFNVDILRLGQGQAQGQGAGSSFVDGPLAAHIASAAPLLPRLFASYADATRRNRGALFGQGSSSSHAHAPGASLAQSRVAGMKFFAACDGALKKVQDVEVAWRARVGLLGVVDAEGLFVGSDEFAGDVLRMMGEGAAEVLVAAMQENATSRGDIVLSAMSVLVRIDYDLLAAVLPSIMPKLLLWSGAPDSAQTFLDLVIEYHAKTRTMDTFLEHAFQACINTIMSPQTQNQNKSKTAKDAYCAAFASPLLTHAHLSNLSRSLHTFLTPGQIPELVETIVNRFSETVERFDESVRQATADEGEGARKKRRKSHQASSASSSATDSVQYCALGLSMLARLASVLLRAVPLRSLPQDAREGVVSDVQVFCKGVTSMVKDGVKTARHAQDEDRRGNGEIEWARQVVLVAALRLRYEVGTVPELGVPCEYEGKLLGRMVGLLQAEAALPELRVEICRTLLDAASQGLVESAPLFDGMLDIIESSARTPSEEWTGHLPGLSEQELPIAIFYLLMERWLPLFDSVASDNQLKRLAVLLVGTSPVRSSAGASSNMSSIWLRALHNAEFWELHRIRDALLSRVSECTTEKTSDTVYELLMWIPMDYLSRVARAELLRRGLAADLEKTGPLDDKDARSIAVVREFLRRVFGHMGSADHTSIDRYLRHLIEVPISSVISSPLNDATFELIRMHITSLLRTASKGDHEQLEALISFFVQSIEAINQTGPTALPQVQLQSLVTFIDILTEDFHLHDFHEPLVQAFHRLCDQMTSVTLPKMTSLVQKHGTLEAVSVKLPLELFNRLLILRQWLEGERTPLPQFGSALAAKVVSTAATTGETVTDNQDICTVILSIARQELGDTVQEEHTAHLESIVAIYLSFYRLVNQHGRQELDSCMSKFGRSLSLSDYTVVLAFVWEGLCDKTLGTNDVVNLVRLSSLLMSDPPDGSLKITQKHWTRCLALFADRSDFLSELTLQTAALELIAKKLNDRPASVRQQDLSSLWSILGSCLIGSSSHYDTTSQQTFRDLISILSALIRLRRDLVITTLPHLGIMLRRLILCLRRLQPQLGAKQSRMVADSLPKWLNPAQPLTAEDSKAVARLLTTLTTKTVPRNHSSSAETQKAESLARPFSKHASHVLGGYVEALTEPLAFIPADVRRELQPGLFSLCEMMGEQNRDAMMVAMSDAGGRTVMKTLWKEYEKQKYVGKG